ncbi:MAG: UDP-diphosphatase, partial [Acidobacteriota bacterium]|nr:UDP-diphosphatase [Acidobacteriota bacterium]
MSWFEAALLGLIQGLTEFLPVSSDGHLSAAEMLLPRFRQVGVLFDVMVHLGTLAAVLVYFRKGLRDDLEG